MPVLWRGISFAVNGIRSLDCVLCAAFLAGVIKGK